jgi:hypothetical protein
MPTDVCVCLMPRARILKTIFGFVQTIRTTTTSNAFTLGGPTSRSDKAASPEVFDIAAAALPALSSRRSESA